MRRELLVLFLPFQQTCGFTIPGRPFMRRKRLSPLSGTSAPYETTSSTVTPSLLVRPPHVNTNAATNNVTSVETPPKITVYDNVFHPAVCEVLRILSLQGTLRRDSIDTLIFSRPPHNTSALTPVEHAIHSALTTLEGSTHNPTLTEANANQTVVEYWFREEFMNIEAHVDIDEVALEEIEALIAPEFSHVLYLRVADELIGQCPTCVFPQTRMGWSFEGADKDSKVDLVSIPAVPGRLLRFPGSAMHAVPCPANRWWLTEEEENFLKEEEKDDEHNDEYDSDEEYESDVERAVLLFNTWSKEPRDVARDYNTMKAHKLARLVEEWRDDYGTNAELLHCLPQELWHQVSFSRTKETAPVDSVAKIALMGDEDRRLSKDPIVHLSSLASSDEVQQLIHHDAAPALIQFEQLPK
mmetsp:Transcript_42750/g.51332  ORF Transcript_42750/g.51332 Transcript_42750/m.51332 type:complete len:412 (+) Transcript_42750:144-1379(+)